MAHTITRPGISRFTDAQRVIYPRILREIQQGRKQTHWMWFVFPQLRALGRSDIARHYGLADKGEAVAYLDHPVLRTRLAECTFGVLSHKALFFSDVDRRKLQACMTLFSRVTADPTLAKAVLDKFFDGQEHQLTLDVLAGKPIVLPPSNRQAGLWPATAMGRVEVRRRWDKQIDRTEPMLRAEVESFIRGFNLSAPATKRIVDEWMADQEQARDQGYHDANSEANWHSA